MKKLALIILAAIGCNKTEPATTQPPAIQQQTNPTPTQPQPQNEQLPAYSPGFIKGYNDGYGGAWLAPTRWAVGNEYRAGWEAGRKDRELGKPHRFGR